MKSGKYTKSIMIIGLLLFNVHVNLIGQDMLTPNLIRNSYIRLLNDTKPAGFTSVGNVTCEAVHPFTKGFEGPYTPAAPTNAATSVEGATKTTPYWFGYYNKGPRARRGGLASGWNSYACGNILKITGNNNDTHTVLFFPFEKNVLGCKVRFRAWVKIVRGQMVSFGSDTGHNNVARGFSISKETTDQAQDGWYRIDAEIAISEVTQLDGFAFSMGLHGDDFEVYLALPHLSLIETESWLPSVSDMLSVNGLTIRPDNGFIGIGTTTPDYKLDVQGTIKATEIKVEAQTADFVFEDDYPLKSLEQVEQFVQENKHLPDIPSAKQMEANGVDLAEMNKLLLQKVEELTLYAIEQQRFIQTQRQQLEQFEQRLLKIENDK